MTATLWYVADIAWALRDLFSDSIDLSTRSFRAFVRGYCQQYPLEDDLLAHLPLFVRMAKLLTYARLVRTMDLPAHLADPACARPETPSNFVESHHCAERGKPSVHHHASWR